ncbi:glycoside hydrolase family 2 TIM barrel-domain containing protein [Maribacter sp. CXY002]|uniref:glycoside hydrolase family 2 TIM barrel-domain containing protein n=1 Tax=Maribacter luteocoastalis TaxID=3407671 RepID=UPI003B677046
MKNTVYIIVWFVSIQIMFVGCSHAETKPLATRYRLINTDWKFVRDSISGAEKQDFDDSQWMLVDLPHDYSIMDLPGEDGPDQIGPFSKTAPGNGNSTGHIPGGTGWYRKEFTVDYSDAGKSVILKFDGVYLESEVWMNGQKVGEHKNGYTPFWYDVTPFLNATGETNLIAVKAENLGRNSRWYSGSGIYRNVHLSLVPPVHIKEWGVHISTPKVAGKTATVALEVDAVNDTESASEIVCTINIRDKKGTIAATASEKINIPSKGNKKFLKHIEVQNPLLWSVETPNLYTAEVVLQANGLEADSYRQTFGIRTISFSADKGFLLNEKPILLKGGCLHHDNGFLGAAAIQRAEERKVELMKANGYNAIRCSHNPPSEAFLNACDELGILVIDEFTDMWESYKNPQDYSLHFKEHWKTDLTNMILRDRNHPSIIMWSIGNEVPKESVQNAVRIGKQLAEHVRQLDNTRAVTEAVTSVFTPDGWENSQDIFGILDVCGYNYQPQRYADDHEKFPNRIMYGSESFALDAYTYWEAVEKYPHVIGDFVWTSMDYIGEVALAHTKYVPENEKVIFKLPEYSIPASAKIFDMMEGMPSAWPNYVAWSGDFDITGAKKPQMLYRDVLWDNSIIELNIHEPIPEGMAENISGWGWPKEWPLWDWEGHEGEPLQVRVFTKAPKVRLELNGENIGEKVLTEKDQYIAVFEVPYIAGELSAIALEEGKEIARKVLKTAGAPTTIRITPERNSLSADRNDLAYITIEVLDANGYVVPTDTTQIEISVSGTGKLVGSGSADPSDMKSVNNNLIKTYKGKAQAIIRPYQEPGTIVIKAEAQDLAMGELKIEVGNSINATHEGQK